MFRLAGFGLCLLLAGAQDPADKVKPLVEKLKSEDIAERDAAAAELVKLGPAVLPSVRQHFEKAEGESRARLEVVIRKLELAERFAKLMAPGPMVTLKVVEKPAAEVLAEISKQATVAVVGLDLPANLKLSLDADRLSLPAAIDELCWRHGGINPLWSAAGVRIRMGAYRKRPTFDAGPFRFIPDGFLWSADRGAGPAEGSFALKGLLVGPPGRLPAGARLEFEQAIDDKGNDLGVTPARRGLTLGDVEWPAADPARPRFSRMVWRATEVSPDHGSAKLATCKGALKLTFILASKRIATTKAKPTPASDVIEEPTSLQIRRCSREGRTFKISYWVQHAPEDDSGDVKTTMGPTWLALSDASGRRIEGHDDVNEGIGFLAGGVTVYDVSGSLVFTLPEGFEPVSVDLMEGTELEELRIPFDLGEVLLR